MASGQLETHGRATSFPPFRPTGGELIRHCARRRGDAPFAVLGDERLTYAEADARSAALAKGLLVAGVGKSSHVGLLAPRQRHERLLLPSHPYLRVVWAWGADRGAGGPARTWLPAPAHRESPGPRATSLGMTETLGPHTFEEDLPLPAGKEGSFGRPVPGVEHRLVDPGTGEDVPPGDVVTGLDHPDRGQDVAAAVALRPGAGEGA